MAADHDRRLAAELEQLGYPPSKVAETREGHYSDFKSPLAFPKMMLADMLARDGHEPLRRRVMNGEFDG